MKNWSRGAGNRGLESKPGIEPGTLYCWSSMLSTINLIESWETSSFVHDMTVVIH